MSSTGGDDLLARLKDHISAISQNPSSTALDTRTFEEAELILPKQLPDDERLSLVQSLVALLPTLQQDPTPPVNLLIRLVEPYNYTDILSLGAHELPWTDGLAIGEHMVSYNRLILTVLEKATAKPSDAAHVAGMIDVMLAVVKLWLCTPDTGISSQASKLLLNLLKVDQQIVASPDAVPTGGQGLVWKRIFGDRDVYGTIFEASSLSGPSSLKLSKSQRTLAQARLMEWLPVVGAMDWNAISRSHNEEIEAAYGVEDGLLGFAALRMVDFSEDVLMHRCLIDFYSDLLYRNRATGTGSAGASGDSPALRYLVARGLHSRTAAIYLQPPGTPVDPLESMFLYGPAANYIATYAASYSEHFLASLMPKQVNDRLQRALDLSPAKWAHADSPKHDLHLIASLPRKSLLPGGDGSGTWNASPVSLLPSRSTNPDVLNTLATVFHGPEKEIVTFPAGSPMIANNDEDKAEAAAARALYFYYLAHQPRFWNDIATHADTVALKDLALSSINCLMAVITANWSTKPELTLPPTIATPESGHLAILGPPALEYALPYLLKPPQTFANLVGGRGDAESAAYKIAAAKFDAVRALHARLVTEAEQHPGEGYEEILRTLNKRMVEGPLSREGEIGGRIGTLEL